MQIFTLKSCAVVATALAVGVAGCGGSSAPVKKARIAFRSPALSVQGRIPASYRCNETGIWLPLQWGALPADTKELVIYVTRVGGRGAEAVSGGSAEGRLLSQQLIVGLKPTLHSLAVGRLPSGALVGYYEPNNRHASICPAKHSAQRLLFSLYALPTPQNIGRGGQSSELLVKLRAEAVALGSFIASYRA